MEAELPGFEKDEIHLDVEDDCLKLSAEHHADSEDKDEQKHYIRKERSDISYQRSFDLTGIDAEKLDAETAVQALTLLSKALAEYRLSKSPRLLVEITLMQVASLGLDPAKKKALTL